jgi:hypothetical protein
MAILGGMMRSLFSDTPVWLNQDAIYAALFGAPYDPPTSSGPFDTVTAVSLEVFYGHSVGKFGFHGRFHKIANQGGYDISQQMGFDGDISQLMKSSFHPSQNCLRNEITVPSFFMLQSLCFFVRDRVRSPTSHLPQPAVLLLESRCMDGRSPWVLVLRSRSARQLKVLQAPWSAGDFPNFMTAGGDLGDLGMLSMGSCLC